ncbi:MAG: hypothetical protein EBZ78_12995 [Verrucomicrobia bacterium]|nr:hypothetical protein [Verrucomicrobiota bacterium]
MAPGDWGPTGLWASGLPAPVGSPLALDNHPAWKDANFEGAERTMLLNGMRMTLAEKFAGWRRRRLFPCNSPSIDGVQSQKAASRQKADWISKLGFRNSKAGAERGLPRTRRRRWLGPGVGVWGTIPK